MEREADSKSAKEQLKDIFGHFHIKSLLAGVTLVAALIASAQYVQAEAASTGVLNSYSAVFASLFIGSSTGHYFGKSLTDDPKTVHSLYFGVFGTVFLYWGVRNGFAPLTYAEVLMAISLSLAHDSLVSDSDAIESLINRFAGGISPVGILLFTVLEFVSPAIPFDSIFSVIVNSLSQNVTLLGAQVNVVIFGISAMVFLVVFLITMDTIS